MQSPKPPGRLTAAERHRRAAGAVLDAIRWVVRDVREASVASDREFGVSAAQVFVLHTLAEHGPLSLGDLAERALTHQSSVSVVARKLSEQGLISRARAATDARRLELSLTDAGRALLARAPESPQERLIAALGRLSLERQEQLAALLGEMVGHLAPMDREPPMLFEDVPPHRPLDPHHLPEDSSHVHEHP
jgi:DNA-binding MarR family transcriptional regulator